MTDDYVIAVRTYKRPEMFRTHTLQVVRDQGLLDRLFVFVGSDLEEYRALEPDLRYVAVPAGGHNAIRAICDYFPRGKAIFFMDDDLSDFRQYDKATDALLTTGLHDVILKGFEQAPFCFGFLTNRLWLRKSPEIRPQYGIIATTAFGAFNEPEFINTTHAHLDDMLRAFHYLRAGRVPSVFPGCSFKTRYGKNPGGLQASGDRADTLKVCEEVTEQAKDWCSEIYLQKEGYYAWRLLPPAVIRKKVAAKVSATE